MKKTLIALAVAASAAVSGSAMAAWVQNGSGGMMEFGGTLTPKDVITPWDVNVSSAAKGLDVEVDKGQKVINFALPTSIPVLGIRVADPVGKSFPGAPGISPQIDYNNAVDIGAFDQGKSTLTLAVKDADGKHLGQFTAPFTAVAEAAQYDAVKDEGYKSSLMSKAAGDAFFGGLGTTDTAVSDAPHSLAKTLDPESVAHFDDFGVSVYYNVVTKTFSKPELAYSGFYSAGIMPNENMRITLDKPLASDAIVWSASMPITVSYQ
ncbi:hypothetical protein AABD61_16105 [Edwardsiella piscicida]|uniref:F4 family fimbrial subunit n=1 Tax=Edwardsiella piscicida TaxID=1263550 RepID=UPI00370D5BBB